MRPLKERVVRQRRLVMSRGPGIRRHAKRLRARAQHPALLIPAFLAGVLVVRSAPLVRKLPGIPARLKHLVDDLAKLESIVGGIAALAPLLVRPSRRGRVDSGDTQSPRGVEGARSCARTT